MAKKNLFLQSLGFKNTYTENGALAHLTTGSNLVDQFAYAGNYRNRDLNEVFTDQSLLWDEDPISALRFPFYLRLITRKIKVNEGFITDKVQNGQGARDEAFKRLLWIGKNHSDVFYHNLWVLPIVGSWKDLWQMMCLDVESSINCFNRNIFYTLIMQGISMQEHVELIKKFMPRIKSERKCTTPWTKNMNKFAKELAEQMGMSAVEYNKFKASGTAHDFQKVICGRMYDKINWSAIPGRALNLLVDSKFIENHDLVASYSEWLDKQPIVKYTGYVYELVNSVRNATKSYQGFWGKLVGNLPLHKESTFNKQFDSLVATAKENGKITEKVWCALDTSGSMSTPVVGQTSALDICVGLGLFFSELNEGAFHNHVVMFDNTSHMRQLTGKFCDKLRQLPLDAMGGTNFQSVVDEIVRVRRTNPNIPLEEYPTTLLVVSDMQFNPAGRRHWNGSRYVDEETNYEASKRKLLEVFPQEFVDNFKFIWWNVNSRSSNFPANINDGGCYLFSGFDGSILSMLLGEEVKVEENKPKKPKSMEEMVQEALSQEILQQVNLL